MVKPQAWTFSAAPIMDNKDHALFQDSSSLECEGPLMPSGQDKTGSSGHSSQTEDLNTRSLYMSSPRIPDNIERYRY
ncbi:hypothetical protein RRG08_048020 [Elysia crispata]|uniref:Uncharacterized protein n=1 Tax=Elysia crispata TaxID=231223 RepID=A0AAE0XSN4_9GAST|nr:hypothetical protein RRG08_048020 [Elysia crispata]